MDRSAYDDEDSSPVNGWIKKEIEDEDFEEYMKHDQDEEHGVDRYEELMSMPKEELVARILQLEEEVRYLQDIRHGLDKNVQGLSTSNSNFSALNSELKNLIETFSSKLSGAKGIQQTGTLPSTGNTTVRPTGVTNVPTSSVPLQRPVVNASTSQASPRSTPTIHTSAPSSRCPPNAPATRSSNTSSVVPSSHITQSVMSTDRIHPGASMSSHETVTITRQTNFIIKTEIPSPPPADSMITETPMPSSSSSTMPGQKVKSETQQQQFFSPASKHQPQNKSFVPNASRSITDIANSIPPHRQRGRGNAYTQNSGIATRASSQQNRSNMQQQPQQQQFTRQAQMMGSGRGGRGRAHLNQRSVPYTTQKPTPTAQPSTAGRAKSMNQQPTPGVNNLLANISLKVPSGITLSIIPPSSAGDKHTTDGARDDPKLPEKNISGGGGNVGNSIFPPNANHFDEEEDFEEDCFEEVAVLIPDKKGSPNVDGNMQGENSKALVASESLPNNQNAFWNSGFKQTHTAYQNNAEYMFEEADDLDSDETDGKR